MPTYTIFNEETGSIKRRITCPANMAVTQLEEDEFLIEGNYNDEEYKIVGTEAVLYTKEEKEDKEYNRRVKRFPTNISNEFTDEELNEHISDYYFGRVDVSIWRVENYKRLRELFYPPITDYLDAQVKIKHSDKYNTKGIDELNVYYNKCEAIKVRFPKQN